MAIKNRPIVCDHQDRPVYAKGLCRACYEKSLRRNNPEYAERQRRNRREWAKRNPHKVAAKQEARKNDPRCRARDAKTKYLGHLRRRGLDQAKLQELRIIQRGECGICGRSLESVAATHIDHDYTTGLARGLLCSRCNNGLGMFCESVGVLRKAISYLENPPSSHIELVGQLRRVSA